MPAAGSYAYDNQFVYGPATGSFAYDNQSVYGPAAGRDVPGYIRILRKMVIYVIMSICEKRRVFCKRR